MLATARNQCIGSRVINPDATLGKYEWKTFREVYALAERIGFGLSELDLNCEDLTLLGIFSRNREEWLIIELACLFQSITTVPISDTICSEYLIYIINQCRLSAICCSKPQFEMILKHKDSLPSLKTLILFDKLRGSLKAEARDQGIQIYEYTKLADFAKLSRSNPPSPESIVTISYTSGTTGEPKGVVINHSNMISSITGSEFAGYEISSKDSYLMYLPHSHIYDRMFFSIFINCGGKIGLYSGDYNNIKDDLAVLKPTVFLSVPRLLNRFYDLINQKFNERTGFRKSLLNNAFSNKIKKYEESGELNNGFWQGLAFSAVRKSLGGNIRIMVCGSAPISGEILKFLRIVFACPIIEGYGLTESCACSFLTHPLDTSTGHIGGPLPGHETRLKEMPELGYTSTNSQIGELLLRGPTIFQGYFRHEHERGVDSEGWLHTGDILQRNDHNGSFRVIDRIKNIIKLSQGEYVSLEKVEVVLSKSVYVSQIFVYGDAFENYLVAVVVPNKAYVTENWAVENRIQMDWEDICGLGRLHYDILNDFNFVSARSNLSSFECVRKVHVEHREWTDADILTSTQKLVRHKAVVKYKNALQEMYSNPECNN